MDHFSSVHEPGEVVSLSYKDPASSETCPHSRGVLISCCVAEPIRFELLWPTATSRAADGVHHECAVGEITLVRVYILMVWCVRG